MQTVNRKVTYRLYPTAKQAGKLLEMLVLHQRLYNAALEQRIKVWHGWQKTLSFIDQCKDLTELRAEFEEYKNINAQSEQVTLRRVDLAFKHFFRRLKTKEGKVGFPRFKSVERFAGFGYKTNGDGWAVEAGEGNKHGRLRLSGLGLVKMRGKVRTTGQAKTLEILHKNSKWYASVTISCHPARERGNKAAGIDWGVTAFATIVFDDETVEQIENLRHIRARLKELREAHKQMSSKQLGSNNRKRARKALSKIHSHIAAARHDFLHKTTAKVIGNVQMIATEETRCAADDGKWWSKEKGIEQGDTKYIAKNVYSNAEIQSGRSWYRMAGDTDERSETNTNVQWMWQASKERAESAHTRM